MQSALDAVVSIDVRISVETKSDSLGEAWRSWSQSHVACGETCYLKEVRMVCAASLDNLPK